MNYGSARGDKHWHSHSHMLCGKKTPALSSSNCTRCGITFSCWVCQNKINCKRCGLAFCKKCCDRTARLVLWGCPNNQVKVCTDCHRCATEENDLMERYLPLLLRGERYKKHGTILVTKVRVQLHPSCRRLEYWKPPSILIRDQAPEVKGIDVSTLRGVYDAHGMKIRIVGLDQGCEKTMQLEAHDGRTKSDWSAALHSLYNMKSVISTPEFSRLVQPGQGNSNNTNQNHDQRNRRKQQQDLHKQQQQASPTPSDIESAERRTKWQERRQARKSRMDVIRQKYSQ